MFLKRKGWGKNLAIALTFVFLFQCMGLMMPETASAATTELTITKYAVDGKTILQQKTVDYNWLMDPDNIPVMGDGVTRYYHQGPVFKDNPDPDEQERLRWNEEEDQNWDAKDMGALMGTNVEDLCHLVGDMKNGDILKIKAADGMVKSFAFKNVYEYDPDREGPMVICWYQDGKYPDSGYTEGMRLVWFAAATEKEGPTKFGELPSGSYHVFGNWDWHQAADPEYWYYWTDGPEEYPTTTGLSVQKVIELNIYSNEPVPVASPVLTADTTDNIVGQEIDITFTDDADWQAAITGITVDGVALTATQYTVTASNINIGAEVFTAVGDYEIIVKASGYSDASINQSINPASPIAITIDGNVVDSPITYTLAELQAMPVSSVVNGGKTYTGVAVDYLLSTLGTVEDDWIVTIKTKDLAPLNVSNYNDPIFAYERDGVTFADDYSGETTYLRLANESINFKYVYGMNVSEAASAQVPGAAFTADKTSGDAPLSVQFTDQSTNEPNLWEWDFDNDGAVDSTEQNPTYEYSTAGTYSVKLTVSNAAGSDNEVKTEYITVTESVVAVTGVNINEDDQTLVIGQTVQLTAVVEPADATNQNVAWSSSEEAIATVSETGLVTAVGEGTASITVTTEDGNFTDNITFTSVPVEPQISLNCNSGVPGANLFIATRGFDADTAGTIWFDTNDNGALDDGEPSVAVNTDAYGVIPLLTSLNVPSVSMGNYTVRADIGDIKATAVFTVTDIGLIISPISGNSLEQGTTPRYITVTGTGFPASTAYRLFVDRNGNGIFDDGAYKSGTTSADGTISVNSMSWPASPTGIYNILLDISRDNTIEASASIGIVPGIKITTPRGNPETNIGMNLAGFSASVNGYVWFDTNGNEVWDEDENKAVVTTSTAGGASSPGLYVPSAPPGPYQVLADIPACGLEASAIYSITGLVLNPSSGTVGTSIDVSGYGLVPNQTGKYIWFDTNDDGTWNEDEPKVDVTTDASGTLSPVSITVPEVAAGTYNVRTSAPPSGTFATFTVDEEPVVAVTGVSITESNQELEIGQTIQLTAVVEPEDAPNKNLSWSSSDEAVATVSETGLVTAVAAGTAEITVTTEDGSKTDSITVTVVEGSGGPTMDILYDGTVELNPSETYTINIGSEEYTVSQNTPLGALHAASVANDFTYLASNKKWGDTGVLLLDDIGPYTRGDNRWFAYVNGVFKDGYDGAEFALNIIELADGDTVEYYYVHKDTDKNDLDAVKAAATAAVKTVASISTMDVLYDETVALDPDETFTITIDSKQYTIDQNTPLGALHAASVANGFTYKASDKKWNDSGILLLDDIGDYPYVKNDSQWRAYVNDVFKDGFADADDALNVVELFEGDKVEFYYANIDSSDLNAVKAAATAAVKIVAATGVAPTEWTLQLSGAKDESVTRAYFEQGLACASSSHHVTWTDSEGNVWGGVPLWLLVGMVDDNPDIGNKHFNFNAELAAAGYEVKVIAGDGWSTVLDSADIAGSDAYIVANTLNGEPLPLKTESDKDCWPLQLKGSAIAGGQQVGNIVRIELSGLPEPPAGWTLEMLGEVGDTITQEEFEEGLACTGSGHYQEWTDIEGKVWSGVPLWVLLGAVDDIENGTHWTFDDSLAANYNVKVVAGDGFNKTFAGADVANSNDYIVANKYDGAPLTGGSAPLRLVGAGVTKDDGSLGDSAVGNIARIEIPELQTPAAEPGSWNLTLKGKISDVISQAEFEEGLACPHSGHLAEWTDSDENVWSGIPLWFLAGWVDDRQPHSYDFNQAVAGYKVLVKASDGYSVDFDSADINKNSNYIIANKCNGVPLTDSGPLRLVGPGVANEGALTGKSVGKVIEIELTSFETGGSGDIPELHIVKYGEDGVTVIDEETITYLDMMEQFDVIGDGTTVYKYQGITNIADDIWSADDETVGGFKIENAIMGTKVSDLAGLVDGMGTGTDITFVAKDGWETTLPYSSIYPDPSVFARQGDAVIAWYADGKYVPDYKDGMRLFFTPEDHIYGQWDMHETLPEAYWHYYYGDVMYPSCAGLSPKYITEIKVYSVSPGDWTLELDGLDIGGLQKEISKTYFESALTCTFGANHKQSYTDSENRIWEGMPLWFLAGFVDDADQHSDNAFNNDLAAAGYQVVLTDEDGYSVTIDSQDIIRNNNYIVANTLDGLLIPETDENWPLKLVGPAVSGANSIGNIVSIELVSSSSLLTPPALTADTDENRVGQAIEITFTEDAAWENAIYSILVNGLNVADTRYTISAGKITIAENVFTEAKDYTVDIKATGYEDASVVQTINSDKAVYTVTPVTDSAYTIGETAAGIKTMTVNAGIAGFNYFTVNIEPIASNSGSETAVFTHLRNGSQLQINSTRADFDQVGTAQAGFNVKAGDIIRVYIVDELTNAVDHNPVILQ